MAIQYSAALPIMHEVGKSIEQDFEDWEGYVLCKDPERMVTRMQRRKGWAFRIVITDTIVAWSHTLS